MLKASASWALKLHRSHCKRNRGSQQAWYAHAMKATLLAREELEHGHCIRQPQVTLHQPHLILQPNACRPAAGEECLWYVLLYGCSSVRCCKASCRQCWRGEGCHEVNQAVTALLFGREHIGPYSYPKSEGYRDGFKLPLHLHLPLGCATWKHRAELQTCCNAVSQ